MFATFASTYKVALPHLPLIRDCGIIAVVARQGQAALVAFRFWFVREQSRGKEMQQLCVNTN
jgi:hypothetical protein